MTCLTCPSCGAIASAESWLNDIHCRKAQVIIGHLPHPLPDAIYGYLSLFRPGQRALGWKKALRLATEIEQLVKKGFVSVKGQVDRNCSPRIWAAAMDQMVEQRDRLSRPMPNHNYLRKVAYDMADRADYQQEQKRYTAPVKRSPKRDPETGNDPLAGAKAAWDAAHHGDTCKCDLTGLSTVIKGME